MARARRTRFVTRTEAKVERLPWGPHDWLARPDILDTEELLMVRVNMPRGKAHEFHKQPTMEEIVYVLEGRAEVWIDREMQILGPGDIAHIPMDVVHAVYNAHSRVLRFLSVFGPARFKGPALVDMSRQEPWLSMRTEKRRSKEKSTKGFLSTSKKRRAKKTTQRKSRSSSRGRGRSR